MRRAVASLLVLLLTPVIAVVPAAGEPGGFSIPELAVSPPTGHFGAVAVGACDPGTGEGCKVRTFKLTNVSSTPLIIGGYGISFPAALMSPRPCDDLIDPGVGIVVQPKESCVISVTMAPVASGEVTAALRILSPSDELMAEVPLYAIGVSR